MNFVKMNEIFVKGGDNSGDEYILHLPVVRLWKFNNNNIKKK